MSAMTKKEWMEYLEKTWDAAQKEAWSEPQFECPRCGHCCQIQQAAQQTVEVMDAHMMRADTEEFYEAKEALRQALDMLNKIADDVYCDQKLEGVITALRQALETEQKTSPLKREWVGLTADEIWECNKASGSSVEFHICYAHQNVLDFAESIESKLREKNGG
jgi:hypothetical protein